MSKSVRRWIPVSLYEIAGIESWLSDLSAQGYALERFGLHFAYFRRTEPCKMIYRLELLPRPMEEPDDEMLDFYLYNGWEYVTTMNRLFWVFRALPGTVEIHTDAVAQGYSYEKLSRKLKQSALVVFAAFLLIAAMIAGIYLSSEWPVLQLVQDSIALNQFLLLLVELTALIQALRIYCSIHRLVRRLKSGLPMEHYGNYRRRRNVHVAASVILSAAVIASMFCSIWGMKKSWEMPLSEVSAPLPLLPLDMVEKSPSFAYRSGLFQGKDHDNFVRCGWSVLSPVQYQIGQRGIVSGEEWPDHSGEYSPSMQIRYYRLVFSALSDPLIDDLTYRYVERYYSPDDNFDRMELSAAGLDRAELFTAAGKQILLVHAGNQVMMLQYYGEKDLAEYTDALDGILAGWSE